MTRRNEDMKRRDDRHEPSLWEKLMMVASALVTIGLVAYTAYHGLSAPSEAPPRVEIVGAEPGPGGEVVLLIELSNDAAVGLLRAVVEVDCDDPPPEATFEQIPAGGRDSARLVCPPGKENPKARLVMWESA
jgi:hypothetical protein